MTDPNRCQAAALATLIVVHSVMVISLFADIDPHPPARIALFGMAPFMAAALSAMVAAMILGPGKPRRALILVSMALSLVSFGPHKLFDPALPLIWPGLVAVWIALGTLAVQLRHEMRG